MQSYSIAKRLVWTYGLIWNSVPGAEIEFLCVQAEKWWSDFENQYSNSESYWTQLAFYHLYNHMTGPGGSGQVHLLFNPQQFHLAHPEWNSPQNIATHHFDEYGNEIWDEWLYPGDTSINIEEMSYFPIDIFNHLLSSTTISVAGQNYFVKVGLATTLRKNWERWHPSS